MVAGRYTYECYFLSVKNRIFVTSTSIERNIVFNM